ncbi:MAG TPA: hypothetical protein VJS17_00535 [Pyrinomonadaceae bacterium]|nr:hypothetical protein [Pyrinomonadaceae bacterium]
MNRVLVAFILLTLQLTVEVFPPDSKTGKGVLLVSLIGERQVAVIDPITQQVLARLPSPQGPHEITLSPDATLAYVADSGGGPNTPSAGNSIVVLDLRTLSVKSTLKTCDSPHDSRVSRNGRILWVACAPAKAILELDAVTGVVRKTWDTKLDGGWFVEITPDDRKIFVPHMEGKSLSMIDRKTSQLRTLISGNTIFGVTVAPVGNEIWISDADQNRLSIVNSKTGSVTASVSLGAPKTSQSGFARLRFTPHGKRVVVVRGSEFVIVDAKRRSIVTTLQMPHAGKVVTISGDSRHAFVSHPSADSVSVINLVSGNVERTFVVGKQPDGIAWAPTSKF